MSELRALLERGASLVEADPRALDRVVHRAGVRRRTRRVTCSGVALTLLAGAAGAGAWQTRPGPQPPVAIGVDPGGDARALAVRSALGIVGATKGAPPAVVVSGRAGGGALSVLQLSTGRTQPLPSGVRDATVSPSGDAVAAVKDGRLVVTATGSGAAAAPSPSDAPVTNVRGPVSWEAGGSLLFTRAGTGWISVLNPASIRRTGPRVRHLQVPDIPGGPILLSVSPAGDLVVLFGLTYHHSIARPHLFIGTFDGIAVRDPRKVPVPAGAVDGPMGWLGENAFLLAPAAGQALIVHTDGSRTRVAAGEMTDPCSLVAIDPCSKSGPRLLGTNAQGSLLFWKLAAAGASNGWAARPALILYYRTWLDGTHAVRLVGEAGLYGPAVAPR